MPIATPSLVWDICEKSGINQGNPKLTVLLQKMSKIICLFTDYPLKTLENLMKKPLKTLEKSVKIPLKTLEFATEIRVATLQNLFCINILWLMLQFVLMNRISKSLGSVFIVWCTVVADQICMETRVELQVTFLL